jgi:hypothetical protein
MKTETGEMTDFSIFEQPRPTFHSIRFSYLHRPQTCHGNLSVEESDEAGRCTEVCELHFVSIAIAESIAWEVRCCQIPGENGGVKFFQ